MLDERRIRGWVEAARAGDRQALDDLLAAHLPLVYNIVGRALDGHPDVDDVVQDTMLRVVRSLAELRDPAGFRSWLVAIAMHRIRDRARARQAAPASALDGEHADPGADFAGLTVLRLGLEGQRREVAEATRWLDAGDRELLALWWLEVAGSLTRPDLAKALGLTRQHTAVRVQRLKERLEVARSLVRALAAEPRCSELAGLTEGWDGRPGSVWRKRIARHLRGCPRCGEAAPDTVPAERLLVGLALVPVPAALALHALPGLLGGGAAHAATAAAATTATGTGSTATGATVSGAMGPAPRRPVPRRVLRPRPVRPRPVRRRPARPRAGWPGPGRPPPASRTPPPLRAGPASCSRCSPSRRSPRPPV
ncbi:RNA polymerase sigma factor [Streptomyces sp. P1-3]|uniref:RNA polymerase sigma factor n=1 Tax=Streptomyces sp. P1-3 TaxID=3421658 RepID=UPI003D36B4A0